MMVGGSGWKPLCGLASCVVGAMIVLYVLLSEDGVAGLYHRPEALALVAAGGSSSRGAGVPHFESTRTVSSRAWSSPSNHHMPHLRRMLTSAIGASDFTSPEVHDQLRNVLSVGERGESRVSSASVMLRYLVDVSLFLRPEHLSRLRSWAATHRQTLHRSSQLSSERGNVFLGVDESSGSPMIVKHLPWNLAQSLAICELSPILSNKLVTCSGEARVMVQKLHAIASAKSGGKQSYANPTEVESILRQYNNVLQLQERHVFAGSASSQAFRAVYNDGAHFVVSPVGLGQEVCDGSRTGRDLDLDNIKVQAAASRAVWNRYLMEQRGGELVAHLADVTESTSSTRAEELLLSKVKIWNPLLVHGSPQADDGVNAAHLAKLEEEGRTEGREADALEVLFRPTLLCVMMTSFGDGLRLAILQHLLWGDLCDDFAIIVASSDPNGQERIRKSFSDLQRVARIRPDRIIHVRMTSDDVKRNLWLQFQLSLGALEEWNALDQTFQYVYFATEDTYMIPENLYDLLLQPEWFTLHAANTPLLLGNLMWEPQEKLMYASSGPGLVLNNVALRILMTILPHDTCRPRAVSNAWEVLLAKCLATVGIHAKDTTDELGETRFHVLSLHWMLLAPQLVSESSTKETWWYEEQLPRNERDAIQSNPFRALSSSSIAFNKVNTPERALWMHMQLRHGG